MGLSNERGSVVVLVAVMLFLIFFCVALVVDIGHIHNVKIELQRAVDAAALAGAQQIPDGTIVDTAGAMVRANGVDKQVDNDKVITDVKPGCWDTQITLGETAWDRFTALDADDPKCTMTTINAVQVTAELNVPHFFAFPVEPTTVTADAIAVAQTINPVLPFAMVSCPSETGDVSDYLQLPDMTIAGITTYEFATGQNSGAWSSLTIPSASANEIRDLIDDSNKLDKFNSVIYGKNLDNDGIENTNVDSEVYPYKQSYMGCPPDGYGTDGLVIPCGLGKIADKVIAAPEEFLEFLPLNFATLDNTGPPGSEYKPTPSFDPLTDFGRWIDPDNPSGPRKPGALPRWYNLNSEAGLQSDDYFARILTQDGILLNAPAKLQAYYDGNGPFPLGTGDDRFRPYDKNTIPNGGDLITCDSKGCRPNYEKVLQRAGYPQVNLTNGVVNDLIATFLEKIGAQGGTMPCSDDDALSNTQQALILKAPMIFVGDCDHWIPNQTGRYIGLAKLLVTRIWANNKGYDCPGSDLQADDESGAFHIEGLKVLPVADDEDPNASLITIFLVE